MSEFIIIQVGQCGNQIGAQLLPEILKEYGITPNSKSKSDKTELQRFMSSFFNLSGKNSTVDTLGDLIKTEAKARIICIDMEDSVVARFKTGKFKKLYDNKSLITNYPGSGNNWAEGFHCHGPNFQEKILRSIQYNLEQCDNLQGFLLLLSSGGGTGSGLGSFIVKLLANHYPTVERMVVCVYPIGSEDVVTCPYNMAFTSTTLLENATCTFPVENRALLENLGRKIGWGDESVTPSTFKPFEDFNKYIVQMILHLTSGSRFQGVLNFDLNEINTNMVPFPKVNFLLAGYSPVSSTTYKKSSNLKSEIFHSSCSRSNQLAKIDPSDRRYAVLSVGLLGRGDYCISDMRGYVDKLQAKFNFTSWSKKSIKIGLCNVPPDGLESAMFTLFNTTSMMNLFQQTRAQFVKLYHRKAHVHHYTKISGFEVDEFEECLNDLNDIIRLHKDLTVGKTP